MIFEKLMTKMINNWILYFVITFILLWIAYMTISNLVLLILRADELISWWKAILSSFLVSAFFTVYVFKIKKKKS